MVALAAPALAQAPAIAPDAPSSYTVQKGDTLWGISGKFLRDPWRWPEVWRLNRNEIKNPHWIYPGDVVRLGVGADGQPQLTLTRETVQVLPTTRISRLDSEAIPTIPPTDVEPWTTKPLITGPEGILGAAEIVAGRERERVVRGQGDRVYVAGMDPSAGAIWYIYRLGKPITSLSTREVLGYENRFLGIARAERFADVSTVLITEAKEEILIGDRLIPAPREPIVNYVPHAPATPVDGQIIASYRSAVEMGPGSIVTLDQGTSSGIDVGTVLAIFRGVPQVTDPRYTEPPVIVRFLDPTTSFRADRMLDIPQERIGLVFVFRAFDRVSYGLILQSTTDPVLVGDYVRKP